MLRRDARIFCGRCRMKLPSLRESEREREREVSKYTSSLRALSNRLREKATLGGEREFLVSRDPHKRLLSRAAAEQKPQVRIVFRPSLMDFERSLVGSTWRGV